MQAVIGNDIEKAATYLKNDALVAIPTETVYGLAGNALSATAIAKIYAAKNRPSFNPLILHLPAAHHIEKYALLPTALLPLTAGLMPGALTLLLKKKPHVPDILTAGSDKVAVRIPRHPLALQLLQRLPFPLAAPSANPSGYVSPTTAQHVLEGLGNRIPYILDGGPAEVGVESTIIEWEQNAILVHRVGGIALEEIQNYTSLPLKFPAHHNGKVQTSGQLKSHYATQIPLVVGNPNILSLRHTHKKLAIIRLKKGNPVSNGQEFPLSLNGSLAEAAANLFAVMRIIDAGKFDMIIAERFPDEGLGRAINDRLDRAQAIWK